MAYPDPPTTPTIPQRGDRATFSGRVDAFLTWVAAIIPWLTGFVSYTISSLTAISSGGAYSIPYRFSYSATGLGSGGEVQYPGAGSSLYVDTTDAAGTQVAALLASMTATANSTIKGQIRLVQVDDPTKFMVFNVSSYSAVANYATFTVSRIDGGAANIFAEGERVALFFQRTGDKGDAGSQPYMRVTDTKALTVQGGSSVVGIQTRDLNTINTNEIAGASLTSNRIVLPAGTYEFDVRAPGVTSEHVASFYNFTDSVTVSQGSAASSLATGNMQTDSVVRGKFTITSQKEFSVRHYFNSAVTSQGLGRGSNAAGGVPVFTEVVVKKVL